MPDKQIFTVYKHFNIIFYLTFLGNLFQISWTKWRTQSPPSKPSGRATSTNSAPRTSIVKTASTDTNPGKTTIKRRRAWPSLSLKRENFDVFISNCINLIATCVFRILCMCAHYILWRRNVFF